MTDDTTSTDSTELERLRASADEAKRERDDLFERLARTQAEFINSRKRLEADREQSVQFANTKLLEALLPVADNLERALAQDAGKVDVATLLSGMKLVHDQFTAFLRSQQLDDISPAPGEAFDPARHQAVVQQEGTGHPAGTIATVLQKGYALRGRLVRPATVAVAR